MTDIVISYSRVDVEFTRSISDALKDRGYDTWADWKDIPLNSKWLAQIETAIEAAHTFLFIISPDSIASEICGAELHHAERYKKKIIPVLYRDVDMDSVPQELKDWQWQFFRAGDDFESALDELTAAIDTDLEYVRMHTHLLGRAREWQNKGRASSLVLRARELAEGQAWLDASAEKKPPPIDLHREYVRASHRARRARKRNGAGVAAVVVALAIALFAYYQRARLEALIVQHAAYATTLNLAHEAHLAQNYEGAIAHLKTLIPAPGERDLREFAWRYLWRQYTGHRDTIFVSGETTSLEMSTDGRAVAISNDTATVTLWDLDSGEQRALLENPYSDVKYAIPVEDGTRLAMLEGNLRFPVNGGRISLWDPAERTQAGQLAGNPVMIRRSPNGDALFGLAPASRPMLWNLRTGGAFAPEPLYEHGEIRAYAFSPDSEQLAIAHPRNVIRLIDTATAQERLITLDAQPRLVDLCFAHGGDALAVTVIENEHYRLTLQDLRLDREMERLQGPAVDSGEHVLLRCSADGRKVAMLVGSALLAPATQHNRLTVWDIDSGITLFTLDEGETGFMTAMAFSPDGDRLATGSRDHSVQLWNASTGVLENTLGIHHGEITRDGEPVREHRHRTTLFASHEVTGGGISHVLFTPDGETLVTASHEFGTVKTWDVDVAPDNLTLPQRADWTTALAVSPDGSRILTGNTAGTITAWDATTYEKITEIALDSGVRALAFAPDGSEFAAATSDQNLLRWRTDQLAQRGSRIERHTLSTNIGEAGSLSFGSGTLTSIVAPSPMVAGKFNARVWGLGDGRRLNRISAEEIAVSADGEIAVSREWCALTYWTLSSAEPEEILSQEDCGNHPLQSTAVSPDGMRLAVAGPVVMDEGDEQISGIRIFERNGDDFVLPLPAEYSARAGIQSLEFSPDGRWLAAVSAMGPDTRSLVSSPGARVTVWDVADRNRVATLDMPSTEICSGYRAASCARLGGFSSDGAMIAVMRGVNPPQAGPNEIVLWEWESDRQVTLASRYRVDQVSFIPGSSAFVTLIAARDAGQPAVVWSADSAVPIATLGSYEATIRSMRYTQDRLLAATQESPVAAGPVSRIWNLHSQEHLVPRAAQTRFSGPVAFSADGTYLAATRGAGVLVWWLDEARPPVELPTGSLASEHGVYYTPTSAFSSDGAITATAEDKRLYLWDTTTGALLHEVDATPPVAFSPAEELFAAARGGGECSSIGLWTGDAQTRGWLPDHPSCPYALAFSPDGEIVVTLTFEATVFGESPAQARLWHVESRKPIVELQGYEADRSAFAAFTPDGKTLATAGTDGRVHLWDPLTGRELLSVRYPGQIVTGLQFAADGQSLAIGYETEVRIWRAASKD